MSDAVQSVNVGKLGVQWARGRPVVMIFWGNDHVFSVRFGKVERPLFSERNRHLPGIPNRWHYFLGKRVTIITPTRRDE